MNFTFHHAIVQPFMGIKKEKEKEKSIAQLVGQLRVSNPSRSRCMGENLSKKKKKKTNFGQLDMNSNMSTLPCSRVPLVHGLRSTAYLAEKVTT